MTIAAIRTLVALASLALASLVLESLAPAPEAAASPLAYPNQQEADLVVKDFRFASGESLPEVTLHYTTLGTPHRDAAGAIDNAVLALHGTTGTGKAFLIPTLGPELFGDGMPLDASRYFVILPDGLGRGGSSKPSDGLKVRFPRYGYADVVEGQHRVVEALGIGRLRLVLGTSMGGMQAWMWGERFPGMMDGIVAVASQPIPVSGRNALWRRLLTESIRTDPDWKGGEYAQQPTHFQTVLPIFNIMTESVTGLQRKAPSYEAASGLYDELASGYAGKADANDWLYWFESSYDYDPFPALDRIRAPVLAVNFADDELNPPQLDVMGPAMARLADGRFVLVPASDRTHGHQSLRYASLWKAQLAAFLADLPGRNAEGSAEKGARPATR